MPNIFWYILTGVIGIGICFCTIYKNKDVYPALTLITFCLFSIGVSWIGEFTVLGLFNSYAYKTGLFESPWAQNVLGHKLLNTTLYPAVALVMVVYSLRYLWIAFVAASFVLIEVFFVKLGAYEQHWWRYYMTAVVTVIYLLITRYCFPKMINKPYGFTRAFTFFFVALVIVDFVPSILSIVDKLHYQIDWINNMFGDIYRSSILILFTYHLIECLFTVIFVCILKKWYWKAAPFVFSIATLIIFAKINVLVIGEGWDLIYSIIINAMFLILFILLEKYGLKQRPANKEGTAITTAPP